MVTNTNEGDVFNLDEAISVLESTPMVLGVYLAGLPEAWSNYQEDTDAWSPRTVLVHYIHNELTNWMPRLRVILAKGENRKFPPFQQLPDLGAYEGRSIETLLNEFAKLREDNLSELRKRNLQEADFELEGEHPVLGVVNLGQLLATWVVHDLNHLHQIAKSMAKRYREAVGPWRPNLAILDA